jgi:hypothetical protein
MGAGVGGVGGGVAEGAGDRRGQRAGVGLGLSGRYCVGGGGSEGATELEVWPPGCGGCAAEGGSGQDEDENGGYGYGYGWWWRRRRRTRSSRGKEDAMTDTACWLTCLLRAMMEGSFQTDLQIRSPTTARRIYPFLPVTSHYACHCVF